MSVRVALQRTEAGVSATLFKGADCAMNSGDTGFVKVGNVSRLYGTVLVAADSDELLEARFRKGAFFCF
jgi:hypothetical protein